MLWLLQVSTFNWLTIYQEQFPLTFIELWYLGKLFGLSWECSKSCEVSYWWWILYWDDWERSKKEQCRQSFEVYGWSDWGYLSWDYQGYPAETRWILSFVTLVQLYPNNAKERSDWRKTVPKNYFWDWWENFLALDKKPRNSLEKLERSYKNWIWIWKNILRRISRFDCQTS